MKVNAHLEFNYLLAVGCWQLAYFYLYDCMIIKLVAESKILNR